MSYRLKNIGVLNARKKDGSGPKGPWERHIYQFAGVEGVFGKLVDPGTPLWPKGSIFSEVIYDEDERYGNVIKSFVLASAPAQESQEPSTKEIKKEWKPNPKDHPIWFCLSYMKEVAIAKLGKLTEKEVKAKGLMDLSDEISDAGINMYVHARDFIKTGVALIAPRDKLRSNPSERAEPIQEPDFSPPGPEIVDVEPDEIREPDFDPLDDDIPF